MGNGHAGFAWVEQLKPLLLEMLAGVRRHRETALLAGFDSRGIVTAALQSVSLVVPQSALNHLRDMDAVKASLRLVLKHTLQAQSECARDNPGERHMDRPAGVAEMQDEHVIQWLAVWLEIFCGVMNELHPKAIEVVMLRVEGCDNRQVARRLGLPLRLVKRVVHDIRQACERTERG
jgi:DNA-binding NarL/FixJ family response regulator